MKIIRTYGRTVIAIVILILSAVLGDVDLTTFEAFLTSIVEEGSVTVGAIAALVAHYFGERKIQIFELPEESQARTGSGVATMLALLITGYGLSLYNAAVAACEPAEDVNPGYEKQERLEMQERHETHPDAAPHLFTHRPSYDA